MASIEQIILYDEGTAPTLDPGALAAYLRDRTGCQAVEVRGPFLVEHSSPDAAPALAPRMARLKVRDVDSLSAECAPLHAEVEFERRRLANRDQGAFGVLYDGFAFQLLLRNLLPADEVRLDRVHIAFTNRLIATWDEDDLRYHLRAIILGLPAIISTTGLVEAPAKPREFYLARQRLGLTARPEVTDALLREQFQGQFLDHDDPRLTEVAKGYAMQAIACQVTGEAFCPDPDCRLFNAHWQEELLRAQHCASTSPHPGEREYCQRHEELLTEMRMQL